MPMPFRIPHRVQCPRCSFKDDTLQYGDCISTPTLDNCCPKCGTRLVLKEITKLEQILRRFGVKV